MLISEELERLEALRRDGVLTQDEFAALRRRVMEPEDRLSKAASTYVNLQVVMSIFAAIAFIVMFLFIAGQFAEHETRMDKSRFGFGKGSQARSTFIEDYQKGLERFKERQRSKREKDDVDQAPDGGEVE